MSEFSAIKTRPLRTQPRDRQIAASRSALVETLDGGKRISL